VTLQALETKRRFHFLQELSKAGVNEIYLCQVANPNGLSQLATIKIVNGPRLVNDHILCRLRNTAQSLSWLRHPNIAEVFDVTTINGQIAVIMEYCDAIDLRSLTCALNASNRTMPIKVALQIGAAIANALDTAYNRATLPTNRPLRMLHGNIEPSNIMLSASGAIKILGFGFGHSQFNPSESSVTQLQSNAANYMAPERLFCEPSGPSIDIYGLASVLFEAITSQPLGKASGRPTQHAKHICECLSSLRLKFGARFEHAVDVERLFRQCLSFDQKQRPTATEFERHAKRLYQISTGPGLSAWAQHEIPLFRANMDKKIPKGRLSGRVFAEDKPNNTPRPHQSRDESSDMESTVSSRPSGLSESDDTDVISYDWEDIPTEVIQLPSSKDSGINEDTVTAQYTLDTLIDIRDSELDGPTAEAQSLPNPQEITAPLRKQIQKSVVVDHTPTPVTPRSNTWILAGGLGTIVFIVCFVAIAGICYTFDVFEMKSWVTGQPPEDDLASTEVVEIPTAQPSASPVDPTPAGQAVPLESSMIFISDLDEITRMMVRCDSLSVRDPQRAVIPLDHAQTCMIRGVRADRSRINVIVDAPTAGVYRCFTDGLEMCERE